jgi:hypothetical protein
MIRQWFEKLMMTFFAPPRLVYVDDFVQTDVGKCVVILAPSDYWAMKVQLDVKNDQEALKYAPALFDFTDEYRYMAQKSEGSTFILLAYSPHVLVAKYPWLSETTLPEVRITFAQWVFGDIRSPVRLKQERCLTLHDELVVEIDRRYVEDTDQVSVDDYLKTFTQRVKNVGLEEFLPQTLTKKTLQMTLFVLMILFFNTVFEIVSTHHQTSLASQSTQELLLLSHLAQTSIERDAVLSSLKQKAAKQLKVREQFFKIRQMPIVAKASSFPPPRASTPPPSGDIILIPGSKPGDPNRLLVGGVSDEANTSRIVNGEGMSELKFDGKNIMVTVDSNEPESLRQLFLKKFKNSNVEVHNHRVEVRIK